MVKRCIAVITWGVLSFVAGFFDGGGCVLGDFGGAVAVGLCCCAGCALTALECIRVSFMWCCPLERYTGLIAEVWGCAHFCEMLYVCMYVCVCDCTYTYSCCFFGVWLSVMLESLLYSYLLFFIIFNCFKLYFLFFI